MRFTDGFVRLQELIDATVPEAIKRPQMDLGPYNQGFTESEFLDKFKCATQTSTSHARALRRVSGHIGS